MQTLLVCCFIVAFAAALTECFSFYPSKETKSLGNLKSSIPIINTLPPNILNASESSIVDLFPTESSDICVVGGGVSGLTAAWTAAEGNDKQKRIVLLEACERTGGRVQSDTSKDGFTFDIGFAVFIEEYPMSQQLFDYEQLNLGRFLPGALVKLRGERKLARVSDPLRKPGDLLTALLAPIGSVRDKFKLIPLMTNVRRKSIQDLFEEPGVDTLTALKTRWKFSDEILDKFFKPFLEGIYLTKLQNQDSRLFSFVFKMFSEGCVALPRGGMASVSRYLEEQARESGVDVIVGNAVSRILRKDSGKFLVVTGDGSTRVEASSVIVATDVEVAEHLISQIHGFEALPLNLRPKKQVAVGCVYYSFQGSAPIDEPILILNGEGASRGSKNSPINNICFPSSVNEGFSPPGYGLCSVTILEHAMNEYKGKEDDLDRVVRKQLGSWFPEYSSAIQEEWKLERIYYIPNAQPTQAGSNAASVTGGRQSNTFYGHVLPDGLFVCGDHMATASLNGALESGVQAGKAARSYTTRNN